MFIVYLVFCNHYLIDSSSQLLIAEPLRGKRLIGYMVKESVFDLLLLSRRGNKLEFKWKKK